MRSEGWPTCTFHVDERDHDHEMIHESSDAAVAFAREHMGEYVDSNGEAVCSCHEPRVARRLGIKPFPCPAGGAR